MARANLSIDESITSTFLASQEVTNDCRMIFVEINKESLVMKTCTNKVGTAEHDFEHILASSLPESQALLVLFCTSDGNLCASKRWMLVSWVPNDCKVRDKMLYSSSREDLKRTIGLGFFEADYSANVKEDLIWAQYQSYISKDGARDDLLSSSEKMVMEEKASAHAESSALKSAGMGVLPFQLHAAAEADLSSLAALSSGDGSSSASSEWKWVELQLNSTEEIISCANAITSTSGVSSTSLTEHMNCFISTLSKSEAKYVAVSIPSKTARVVLFLFVCPEETPIRVKMTMSSAKATVIAYAERCGLKFDKASDVRDIMGDMEDLLNSVLPELNFITPKGASQKPGFSTSLEVQPVSAKPQRPGKGRAKVNKFKLDAVDGAAHVFPVLSPVAQANNASAATEEENASV